MGSAIANIVIIMILLAAVSGACAYIYKEKKRGRHCIGCPYSGACPKKNMNKSGFTCSE